MNNKGSLYCFNRYHDRRNFFPFSVIMNVRPIHVESYIPQYDGDMQYIKHVAESVKKVRNLNAMHLLMAFHFYSAKRNSDINQ